MKPYLRITLWYLLFGGLWISLTDRLISPLASDSVAAMIGWQTIKGWIYVAGSGGLIFFLTRRAYRSQVKGEKERLAMFKHTVRQSHHILLNYFNQMQLVVLEAERSADFDKSMIEIAREATDKATIEVHRLDRESDLSPEKETGSRKPAEQVHADDL